MVIHPTTGRAVYGFGPVSVDGKAVAPGNNGAWLNEDEIVYQDCSSGECVIVRLNLRTTERVIVSRKGAYDLMANENLWAATYNAATDPSMSSVRTNSPALGPFDGMKLFEVTESGQLVMFTSPATGAGITVYGSNGQLQMDLPVPLALGEVVTRYDHAAYYDGLWHIINVRTHLPLNFHQRANIRFIKPVLFEGRLLLMEYEVGRERLTVRDLSNEKGWVIPTVGQEYFPDIRPFGTGLRVGYTTDQGGGPDTLRLLDLDFDTGAYRVFAPEHGAMVVVEVGQLQAYVENPPTPMPKVEDVRPMDRAFTLAPFIFNDYDEGSPLLGNNRLPIRSRLMWAAVIGTAPDVKERKVILPYAVWAGEDTGAGLTAEAAIDAARPIADKEGAGLVVYQDSRHVRESVLAKLKSHDILAPQFYKDAGESWDDFMHFIHDESERLTARKFRLMPVLSVYDRNGTLSDADMAQVIVLGSHLAAIHEWFGAMLFRFGTKDGLTNTTHTALRPYLERFFNNAPLPDQPKPEKPTLIVKASGAVYDYLAT